MSDLMTNYARNPIELVDGKGCHVTDANGKTYLDFTSGIGVLNLGHNYAPVVNAVEKQLQKIWHTSNLYNCSLQEEVAHRLANGKNYKSFFCNSGTEANEAAIKLIRKATGKTKIVTFYQSFHGRTMGSLTATAQEKMQQGFKPLVPDFHYLPYNDISVLDAIDESTAGMMLEVIQGEGGINLCSEEWLVALSKKCIEVGALMSIDEVQTGMGRTGSLYAWEQYPIEPDMFTLAKGLGNGLPVGALLAKEKVAKSFTPGSHGSTFGGNKLAMASANEVVSTINQIDFLTSVKQKGNYLINELKTKLANCEKVLDIRGHGLMIGIELNQPVSPLITQLMEERLLVLSAGANVLRLLPALIISENELDEGINSLVNAIENF